MKFEYARIHAGTDMLDRDVYKSDDFTSDTLEGILNEMGDCRWELVGEVDDQIIMKRIVQ